MSTESVMPSNHFILYHLPFLLPLIFPSIREGVSSSFRWPKYCSFSFNISPSWLDLLAIQGTLKSLFQHNSSKASILRSLLPSEKDTQRIILSLPKNSFGFFCNILQKNSNKLFSQAKFVKKKKKGL